MAVAFFGDGAVNNGAFHEGLNMASIWKLPVLFVCENNQFATEVPFAYSAGNPTVAARAEGYGLPGVSVDGNDVLAVYDAAAEAVERARSGGGATLIECLTYRTRPHAEGMGDYSYRTREDVEQWKTRCPIARLRTCAGRGAGERRRQRRGDRRRDQGAGRCGPSHGRSQRLARGRHGDESHLRRADGHRARAAAPHSRNGARTRNHLHAGDARSTCPTRWQRDPGIFVLGEGIGVRGGNFRTTVGLFEKYGPLRLCDTPICERGFVGLGCGAAMTGTRPVVDFMFADFVLDGVGEIINQIAKIQYMSSGRLKMPVLLRGCIGIGHSAATHHSGNYYPMYAHFPGLSVVVPATPYDAKGLLQRALSSNDPVLFLEHREVLGVKGFVPAEAYEIEFGKAAVVREGTDATVVALAWMVHQAAKACDELAKEGDQHRVDRSAHRFAVGHGHDCPVSVAKTGRLLIVDEAFAPCGLGSEIAAQLVDRWLRRSRRADPPLERRPHADALQPAAGSRRGADAADNRTSDSRPVSGIGTESLAATRERRV